MAISNPFARSWQFLRETQAELQKVSWSDRRELVSSTVVVIVTTGLLAVFIGLCDLLLSRALSLILR
jgi:preprotein translocase subunit SecE